MNDDARALLTRIGQETSLRYAMQLITASSFIARRRKVRVPALMLRRAAIQAVLMPPHVAMSGCAPPPQAAQVEVEDVKRAYTLFLDQARSSRYLEEHQEEYLFNQAVPGAAGPAGDAMDVAS